MKNLRVLILLLFLAPHECLATGSAGRAAPSPVYVTFWKRQGPGQVEYRYVVWNGSPRGVTKVRIGWDMKGDRPELVTAPMRWRSDEPPPSSITSPPGWKCRVVASKTRGPFFIEWETPQGPWRDSEVTIAVKESDASYEKGHWALFAEGRMYSGVLHEMKTSGGVVGLSARDSLEQAVLDYVLHPAIDSPDPRPLKFGTNARPIVRAMIDNADYDRHLPQLLHLLGFVGDARDTPLLESFVLRGKKNAADFQLPYASSALSSLGRLSTRDPKALEFLRQATNPDFFRGSGYAPYDLESLRLVASHLAISALGLSRNPEAGHVLAGLQKHPYHSSQIPIIKDAIARRARNAAAAAPQGH